MSVVALCVSDCLIVGTQSNVFSHFFKSTDNVFCF